ncbi:hypothetical protein, partial [Bacillus sp. JJ722]|uniref:hypothetical protein n=1 Tax=Bacillus sp. JJ722 TaxID=3122973 RepID=UPI002FFE1ED2
MISIKKMFVPILTVALISVGSGTFTAKAAEDDFIQENPWDNGFENVTNETPSSLVADSSEVFWGEKAEEDFERLQRESEMDKQIYESQLREGEDDFYSSLLPETSLLETPSVELSSEQASTKSQFRAQFRTMALAMGSSFSLPLAGNYMYHSLQDNPSAKLSPAGSGTSNALSNTRFYTDVSIPIAENIDVGHKNGRTSVSGTGSKATSISNSGLDFYLTIGKIGYEWAAGKQSNGTWKVVIRFHDTYNYEHIYEKRSSFPGNAIDTINNYAAKGQNSGAIVGYPVHIT